MSLLVDRSRERTRNRDDQRIRSSQEARPKDTYYRPEYGWIMSDADVKTEQGVKRKYDDATKGVEEQISSNVSDYNESLLQGRSEINAAYDDGISKLEPAEITRPKMDWVTVQVMDRYDEPEGDYYMTRDVADQVASNNGLHTSWDKDVLKVSVRTKGGGKIQGQEIHDSLRKAQEEVFKAKKTNEKNYGIAVEQSEVAMATAISNANEEREARLDSFNATSQKSFDGAQAVWDAELKSSKAAYGKRVTGGKKMYEDSKKKYNESVTGVDSGLLESPTNQVMKPEAK